MKSNIIFLLLSGLMLLSSCSPKTAQVAQQQENSTYGIEMQKAFQLFGEGELMKASSVFERIALADKSRWIPYYFAANTAIISTFEAKDKTQIPAILERAEGLLKKAEAVSENNSELVTLRGLLLTARIVYNPMENGARYSGATIAAFKKAMKLDPTNPRPMYLLGQFQVNASKFFGDDPQPYCNLIQKSITLFDNFKAKEKYAPEWGKEQALQVLANAPCK